MKKKHIGIMGANQPTKHSVAGIFASYQLKDTDTKTAKTAKTDYNLAGLAALGQGDIENFITASTPGGIERQEKQGQLAQAELQELPAEINCHKDGNWDRDAYYSRADIKVLGPGSQLFLKVQLPTGWKKQPTEHSMWTNLLDQNGHKRASIFFKAAFYDYEAFISFNCRYTVRSIFYQANGQPCFDLKTGGFINGLPVKETHKSSAVVDNQTHQILFESPRLELGDHKSLELGDHKTETTPAAETWLKQNYPQHTDEFAYWDK